ncbi:HNH endonuclease [Streptomyces sp. ISL-98]|nr:HNH endonuclease [Streptomyces sp. ISL-98]
MDSGASQWTPARREAYVNDLTAPTSLVAVTAASNRSKADQDPSTWLPTVNDVHCQYAAKWTGIKMRWGLTVDAPEKAALVELAEACPDTTVTYEPAP